MAHGRPWYKRNGGDFVMAVMDFPDNDHRWAYSAIIDTLNDRDRPIADDPAFVSSICRVTRHKWTKIRRFLLANGYLILTAEGRLTNPRFEREHAQRVADHERSVEAGRSGGKKSAAMRAAGQGQLDLPDENTPENLQESYQLFGEKHGNFSGSFSEKFEGDTAKNNNLGQAPPQATRGRERASEARDKRKNITNDDGTTTLRAGETDLLSVTQRVAEAAGMSARFASRPSLVTQSMDIVKGWIAAGIDVDGVALPIIKRMVADNPDTGSLHRFTLALDKAKATKAPPPAKSYTPVPPIFDFDDETPPMHDLREGIAGRIGEWAYATLCHEVRLTREDDDILRVDARTKAGQIIAKRLLEDHGAAIRAAAKAQGFNRVWGR